LLLALVAEMEFVWISLQVFTREQLAALYVAPVVSEAFHTEQSSTMVSVNGHDFFFVDGHGKFFLC
jgi:hypothetical protein